MRTSTRPRSHSFTRKARIEIVSELGELKKLVSVLKDMAKNPYKILAEIQAEQCSYECQPYFGKNVNAVFVFFKTCLSLAQKHPRCTVRSGAGGLAGAGRPRRVKGLTVQNWAK